LYRVTMGLHRVTMRLYRVTMRLYRVTMRLYRVTMRLYRVTMRLYRVTMLYYSLPATRLPIFFLFFLCVLRVFVSPAPVLAVSVTMGDWRTRRAVR
ncbi:hypothetical protein, partial [Tolypothrix sp. VBCCA 56010]|uniref:hypothetical protein n=1 Tax=Tolypothrix sp. VBCCA 56010 TaxID=3137731 RepID=UPI003D7F1381